MAWSDALAVVAAVGAGVMGGVFFAFSVFVMRALDRLPTLQAVAAMQAINVTVITPLFMLGFVGTALLSVAVLVVAATGGFAGSALLGAAGAIVYLIGTFGLTAAYNVPRNNRLEQYGDSAEGVELLAGLPAPVDPRESCPNRRGHRRGSAPHSRGAAFMR